MANLKTTLKQKLKDAKRIVVLGIGSELRADDVAGILIAEELKKIKNSKLKVVLGFTAPENFTGEIIKFKPTHIIIVDSVDIDQKPGYILLINPDEVGGISFSTHMLPVKMMVDYLLASLECEIIIVGIQPKILLFGEAVSKEVKKSTVQVSGILQEILLEEF
jgi:hydrogenase 3 maturation protease